MCDFNLVYKDFFVKYFQVMRVSIIALILINIFNSEAALAKASKESGIELYGVLVTDVISNTSGGLNTGTSVFTIIDLGVDADMETLLGWKGVTIHLGTLWGKGEDPSEDAGDFNALSNIIMPEGGRIFEVYLEKTNEDNSLRIKTGLIGMDGDFQGSDYSAPFINSGFGVVPTLSGNMATPIYPQAALGIVVQYANTESSYLQLGIFDGDAGNDDQGNDIDLDSVQGATILFEYGTDALNGNYKIGAVYHTGEFTDINTGLAVDGNSSFYAVIDQALITAQDDETKLAGFMRLGYSPQEERNTVSSYIEFGINLFEPIQGRENDLFAIGFLYTNFSDDFINAEITSGNIANASESVLEILYQAEITSWLVLKPDIQFILDPLTSSEDATIVGLRLEGQF